MAGTFGGVGVRSAKVGGADLERERGVSGEHVDELADRQRAGTECQTVVEGFDDEVFRCRCGRIAQLDVGQPVRIDHGDVGDRPSGSGEVEIVDQYVRVRSVDRVEDGDRLWQIADRHERHELEAAPDAVRGGQIAEFTEAIHESVVVDASGHDQEVAGTDRCGPLDHGLAVVAVGGHEDRLHVQRDQTRVVEAEANLAGNCVGPCRSVVPDAARRPARGRTGRHELGRSGLRADTGGEGEQSFW